MPEIAQPALFALQVGITRLRQLGITPAAVTGHSVGEVAAAWASGALTLADAVEVIYRRSQLQATTKGRGQMSAVVLDQASTNEILEELGLGASLAIAGVNSARGVTVAGDPELLARLEAALSSKHIVHKRLNLDYAFHSPAMDSIEIAIGQELARLQPRRTRVPFSLDRQRRLAGRFAARRRVLVAQHSPTGTVRKGHQRHARQRHHDVHRNRTASGPARLRR